MEAAVRHAELHMEGLVRHAEVNETLVENCGIRFNEMFSEALDKEGDMMRMMTKKVCGDSSEDSPRPSSCGSSSKMTSSHTIPTP